jgi:hypothetical protein
MPGYISSETSSQKLLEGAGELLWNVAGKQKRVTGGLALLN